MQSHVMPENADKDKITRLWRGGASCCRPLSLSLSWVVINVRTEPLANLLIGQTLLKGSGDGDGNAFVSGRGAVPCPIPPVAVGFMYIYRLGCIC